jgi:hypothetical protein
LDELFVYMEFPLLIIALNLVSDCLFQTVLTCFLNPEQIAWAEKPGILATILLDGTVDLSRAAGRHLPGIVKEQPTSIVQTFPRMAADVCAIH